MAIYWFPNMGVLWSWQWSNTCTKFHQEISIFAKGQTVTWISTRLFILIIYIYITLYLTRLVFGDTNNRWVNKTIILCSNMLQEYKNHFLTKTRT